MIKQREGIKRKKKRMRNSCEGKRKKGILENDQMMNG